MYLGPGSVSETVSGLVNPRNVSFSRIVCADDRPTCEPSRIRHDTRSLIDFLQGLCGRVRLIRALRPFFGAETTTWYKLRLLVSDCFHWIQTRSFDCRIDAEDQPDRN